MNNINERKDVEISKEEEFKSIENLELKNNYLSFCNNEEEVKHDGTLIAKAGIKNEQLKFDVEMDVIIKTSLRDYSTTIKLNLPIDNILEKGMCSIEKNDSKEFVFKRTKIN